MNTLLGYLALAVALFCLVVWLVGGSTVWPTTGIILAVLGLTRWVAAHLWANRRGY
jgi:hypothetical protein